MKYYAIAERENGDILESAFMTHADAEQAVQDYEDEDREHGVYNPYAYEVIDYIVLPYNQEGGAEDED